jgi:uncharacterized damage-inducible protein DinB
MNALLQDYAQYNYWANKLVTDVFSHLSDEQMHAAQAGSFGSGHKTVAHMAGAENIWLQRLTMATAPVFQDFNGLSPQALLHTWLAESEALKAYVGNLTDTDYLHIRTFTTRNGQSLTQTLRDCLLHVFNHSTFHRGQLITMMRALGITDIPQTDYIFYKRQ